jgi:hypothetical protein
MDTDLTEKQKTILALLKRICTAKGHFYACELAALHGDAVIHHAISQWTVPAFPVTGEILKLHGYREGPEVGVTLRLLTKRWQESDYTLTADELIGGLVKDVAVVAEPIE